jgi:hypothetical protein
MALLRIQEYIKKAEGGFGEQQRNTFRGQYLGE